MVVESRGILYVGGAALEGNAELAFAGTKRFEVRRRLGAGGMGVVYEAYDRERQVSVALKTLRHIDAAALSRFKREFRALQNLEHPNLISLGELIADDGDWFFTMEIINGKDFAVYVRPDSADRGAVSSVANSETTISGTSPTDADSPGHDDDGLVPRSVDLFDEERLRNALSQLAQGIAALHLGGKVHRDIKPSNILVADTGRVVLLDFGLVTTLVGDRQSSSGSIVGTAEYIAPEQALGRTVGAAADWYAMGVVLYEALTRRLPHVGANSFDLLMKKQQRAPIPASRLVPDLPPDLGELCQQLLQIDPALRPSAQEVLERLGGDGGDTSSQSSGRALPHASSVLHSAFTQQTPFVGREDELETLRQAFRDSRKGAPVSVFVHGDSGLGKSSLVSTLISELVAENEQVLVFQSRCYEREFVPYNAFDGIADALSGYLRKLPAAIASSLLPLRAGLLPHLFPALQQVDVIAGARMQTQALLDPQERRTRMFQAFRELLARVADRCPVVLVIDDFQWAGADSLTMLEELMHASAAPDLLLLGTARPGSQQLLSRHSSGDVRHLHLGELSPAYARELVTLLAPALSDTQIQSIVDDTSGHPLFILELVRHLAQGGTGGKLGLDDALWARIVGLEPPTRLLLEVLTVAGTPLAQTTAAAAAGLAYADYEKAVRALRIGFLARTRTRGTDVVEPYHSRIREAVLARLDPQVRTRHHRCLANALARAGLASSDPQVLVRHLAAAGDSAQAAAHAEAAALRANAMSAFDQAAELFTTVLELGGHDQDKTRELRLALGASLVAAGRGQQAAAVFLQAAEGAAASVQLECQRQAAEQLLISGHLEQGLDGLTNLLGAIDVRIPATPRRALMSLLWQRAKLRLRGLRWTERQETQILAEQLTRLDIYKVVSHGLGIIDIIRGMDFQARGLLLALRTGERARVARALFYEAIFFASGGPKRAARARELLDEGAKIAAPLQDPYLTAWKIVGDGCLEYFVGHYRVAAGHLAQAEEPFRETVGATWERSTSRLFRLWSLHRIGALAEMTPLLSEYLRDAKRRGDLYVQTTMLRSCHRVLLVTGSVQDAQRELAAAEWIPSQGRYHLQHWYDFYARAEISLYSGTSRSMEQDVLEHSRRLKNSLLLRVRSVRVEFQWLRARLLLADAPDQASLREVGRFARQLERDKFGFALVLAKLVRAAVAVQKADVQEACGILKIAIEDAEQQDMLLYAAAAQRRLAELIGGDEGLALTRLAEQRMSAEGVRDRGAMSELLSPGFTTRGKEPFALAGGAGADLLSGSS